MLRKAILGFPPALILSILLLAALPAAAATYTFELDPATTRVEFTFGATLHTVDGTMKARQGEVKVDPEAHTASGRFVLDATSAATGIGRRDAKMHEKILESQTYPDIVFEPQRVSGQLNPVGRGQFELHGVLELHGTRRPMDMTVISNSDGTRVTATGKMVVPYLEWGMKDPSFFILRVEKEVRVTIHASGKLSAGGEVAGTPGS
jgi:polyisoprenoid-binding protein YceI